jgi:hypothetical protein
MAAADAEPLQQERIPPGVHLVDDVRLLARVFPDIKAGKWGCRTGELGCLLTA